MEFDFLVCSQFLRSSLTEHIVERGVSTEEVIDVEYVEKHPSPEPKDCLIHDDWVSAVAVCGKWLVPNLKIKRTKSNLKCASHLKYN